MAIKGKLIIVGGGINTGSLVDKELSELARDSFFQCGILKTIIDESKHQNNSRIEIITTASKMQAEVSETYMNAFNVLGAINIGHFQINSRVDANNLENLERLKQADTVLFTGGDQLRLTSIIGGTEFQKILLDKYNHEEFVYAGTSAGAAAVSSSMIYQGNSSDALFKGSVEINSGLGLIDSIIVDTHFIQRGRIGRLFQVVVGNPMKIGIGLGEDTGLLITNNNDKMTAIGSGSIILVDGRQITDTNLTQIETGRPISISNIITHVMTRNDIYYFKENKIIIKDSQYNII
mgnify:CR=1 FL=1